MTINERTSLLPKEYQKAYSIAMPQDDVNNNVSASLDSGVLSVYDSYALTKDELNKYITDPWWVRMRYGCFATCWIICLVALAISLYIAVDAMLHDHCGVSHGNDTLAQTTLLPSSTSSIPSNLPGVDTSTPLPTIVFTLLNQLAS